jgi:hypothetical protein
MSQLRALVSLRWRMVRSRRVRLGLLLLLSLLPLSLVEAVVVGQALPPGKRTFDLLLLAPTLYVLFAVLAVIAPLVAGGGNELFPDGHLVAYPIQPRTVFASGLLMAPLNLAWVMQVVALVGVTAAVSARGPRVLLAVLTVSAYVAAVTTAGQSLAWFVVGVRHRPGGRLATQALGAALALAGLVLVATGSTTRLLDRAPTTRVVIAAVDGAAGRMTHWSLVTLVLAGLCVVFSRVGRWACAWALRRAVKVGSPEVAPVGRRPARRTPLAELVAVDHASVWRSTPLRRGAIVLAVLPGAVAMLARPTWASLALLPGLVAAGAGLLFGVNTFCLDGAGAMWVATLPHPPRTTLLAKLWVVGETCLAAVLIAVVLAATRVRDTPSPAELVALLGSALGSTLLVVALCARLSVTRPHKADLRGPRDTPAPPATMAVYSLRLALGTTWAGLAFTGAGASGSWPVAVTAAVLVIALGARSLLQTLRYWSSPVHQAQVVTTVSYG